MIGAIDMATDEATLYERLGGRDAIDAAVDAFHERVATDDRVNHYFEDVDMERLLSHQKAFFVAGTGGPGEYPGGAMDAVHAPYPIDETAFEVFVGHLEATLRSFGVPDRERGEVLEILEGFREEVVNR